MKNSGGVAEEVVEAASESEALFAGGASGLGVAEVAVRERALVGDQGALPELIGRSYSSWL